VEAGALVVEGLAGAASALLAGAESAEVLGGLLVKVSGWFNFPRSRAEKSSDEDSDSGVLTLGVWSAKSSMTMRPAGAPPMVMSK
jgi:hypothetical protein